MVAFVNPVTTDLLLIHVSPEIFPSVDDGTLTPKHDPSKTTARLLEVAAKEFIERGYEAARVSDIARRAGVTTGAIYARWPTRPT